MNELHKLVDDCYPEICEAKKNSRGLVGALQPYVTKLMSYCAKIDHRDAVLALYPFIEFNDEGWLKEVFEASKCCKWEFVQHCYLIHKDRRFLRDRLKRMYPDMEFLAICLGALYLIYEKEKEVEYVGV